eukprot:4262956-Pleurochrysis_carterae.AAC.3
MVNVARGVRCEHMQRLCSAAAKRLVGCVALMAAPPWFDNDLRKRDRSFKKVRNSSSVFIPSKVNAVAVQ